MYFFKGNKKERELIKHNLGGLLGYREEDGHESDLRSDFA